MTAPNSPSTPTPGAPSPAPVESPRSVVRRLADEGRHAEACDVWIRHLNELEEQAEIEWGHTLGKDTADEWQARMKVRDAQTAVVTFTTAARGNASAAIGALVVGWPAVKS